MKYVAIFLVIALLAALAGVGYLYMNCNITVEAVGASAVEASTQEALFQELKTQLEENRLIGTRNGSAQIAGSAEDYQFITYTLRLKNGCFVAADMVELQVTMRDGDILQVGDTGAKVLKGQTTGDIQATILADRSVNPIREITVSYYVWGIPFMMTTYNR